MTNARMDGLSMNIEKESRQRLQSVFPECFSEGTLDIDKLLQSAYFRQVKMIYIDPPYNTGNDFVYEDDFKDPLAKYLEVTSQATKSNPETMGRFHTAWLNMMYPRLRLAANLLRDDGVIAVNIDEHEIVNLLKIMDEVFGEENNLGVMIWDKRNPKGDAKGIAYQHEYIVFYAKSKDILTDKNEIKRPKKNAKVILNKASELYGKIDLIYTLEDANRDFSMWIGSQNDFSGGEKAYSKIDNNGNVYRPVSMAWPNKKQAPDDYFKPLIHPITKKPCPIPERGWRNPPTTMKELLTNGQILFGKDETTQPNRKYLLKDNMHENLPSLIYYGGSDTDLLSKLGIPFETPKTVDVCKEHIQAFTKNTDIILDFFSGSATTAHAVMQLNKEDNARQAGTGNRRFICVQLPEVCDEKSEAYKAGYKNICEIGKERIRRAGAKLLETDAQIKLGEDHPPLDTGFKVFKLDSSNIKFWDGIPVGVGNGQLYFDKIRNVIDGIKDDRPPLDVVYELMLKLGVPLTCEIEEKDILGKTVYSVDGDLLLFCLDKNITADFIEALADLAPAKIIVAEMGFADDTAMANAHYILRDKGIEIKLV